MGIAGHLEQLQNAAEAALGADEYGAYASLMKQIGDLSGYTRQPLEAQEPMTPEEARRLTEQAGRAIGMVFPKEVE